jgi:hypothetical protein
LPSLEYLNGLAVERDALFNEEGEEEEIEETSFANPGPINHGGEEEQQQVVDVVVEEAQEEFEISQR